MRRERRPRLTCFRRVQLQEGPFAGAKGILTKVEDDGSMEVVLQDNRASFGGGYISTHEETLTVITSQDGGCSPKRGLFRAPRQSLFQRIHVLRGPYAGAYGIIANHGQEGRWYVVLEVGPACPAGAGVFLRKEHLHVIV